ncbi:hypothetical protein [Flavobacterium sp. HNIBRBA15423]|uniref:hypothetical protein n=1 Tax=Flavobacterium sp. HNIBRBA15423 TaxID=3458683 RepID=UPI004043FC62
MRNNNNQEAITTLAGASYKENFAFSFLGQLISHDKRFFETLQAKFNDITPFIMSTHFMDEKTDRESWFDFMCIVDDLASVTSKMDQKELDKQFNEALELMGFKKGSEVKNV